MSRIEVLQLCPLMPDLEVALRDSYAVHRWFEIGDKPALLRERAPAIRGVVTGGHLGIANDLAAALPGLEIVAINGVGFDKVDLDEARRRGYRVSNTPDVLTDDVADLAIGQVIALSRRLAEADRYLRNGSWKGKGDLGLGRKVTGRRFGIMGLGRVGLAIAKRLEGFGGTIAYTDLRRRDDVPYAFHPDVVALAGASDVLIVAAAASQATERLVNGAVFDALGRSGILVNVARGSIVDEPALVDALVSGRLGGAALDVFADEPNVPAALIGLPNVVLTPHIASATIETRRAMADLVLANLAAHFSGRPLPTPVV